MKVWYPGDTPTEHTATGVQLRPGANDIGNHDAAVLLMDCGLVKPGEPAAAELLQEHRRKRQAEANAKKAEAEGKAAAAAEQARKDDEARAAQLVSEDASVRAFMDAEQTKVDKAAAAVAKKESAGKDKGDAPAPDKGKEK